MTRLLANAKLTLSLRVTGRRADGFHLIDAEMVSLDLADELEIESAEKSSIEVSGPFADGVPTDESNLCLRALALAGRTASIRLRKAIPHGGGLGGGSADAAAVLRWAGFDDLIDASRLGADIPFCLVGGRARVTGIGEIVEPLPTQRLDITLVIPPLSSSTPAVYAAWDAMGGSTGDGRNDLEPAAIAVTPELAGWRDAIRERCGAIPVLAGSGATWFVEGRHGDALAGLTDEGARVVETSTLGA